MILHLRKAHRLIFSILALALPAAFVAGILFGHDPLPTQKFETFQQNAGTVPSHLIFESDALAHDLKITMHVFTDTLPPAQLAVELYPAAAWAFPEVLVYWSEDSTLSERSLSSNTFLLGSLAGTQRRRWLLPQTALQNDGHIMLFSLAHQKLIAQLYIPLSKILQKGAGD